MFDIVPVFDRWQCFTPGKKDPAFIQSEYRVKDGKNNQRKKNKDEDDEHQEQKKKNEEKSKIQTVELNVNLCCDNCVRRVKQTLENVEGKFYLTLLMEFILPLSYGLSHA